jgi:hypothetical protein
MPDPGEALGMTYKEISTGLDTGCQPVYDVLLRFLVEIDHHITAKNCLVLD